MAESSSTDGTDSSSGLSPQSPRISSRSTVNSSLDSKDSWKGYGSGESRPSVVNPSSTNNLREDISNQPATRGAVNEGVVDLTDSIAKDLKVPRQCGGFSDVWKGYLKDSERK
ncbi:hypothetical protein FRC12_013487 [Ceratobasidium sp. 428]|nr:hypothetical protein FRC12_013487 [Ceratobasidium sp. 428]